MTAITICRHAAGSVRNVWCRQIGSCDSCRLSYTVAFHREEWWITWVFIVCMLQGIFDTGWLTGCAQQALSALAQGWRGDHESDMLGLTQHVAHYHSMKMTATSTSK